MDKINKKGMICVKYNNIQYGVCSIEHIQYKNEDFKYIFTPNYSVIDLLPSTIFQGIPGLNLDLRESEYVRNNITPSFISERVPSLKREELYVLLKEVDMDYLDPIEYLIRTNKKYSGDNFYVVPYFEPKIVYIDEIQKKNNTQGMIKIMLSNIALGNTVIFNSAIINDENRKEMFCLLNGLYMKSLVNNKDFQKIGIEQAKLQNKYKGRKAIEVDTLVFLDLLEKVNNKTITVKEACDKIHISVDKFYRLKKNLQK